MAFGQTWVPFQTNSTAFAGGAIPPGIVANTGTITSLTATTVPAGMTVGASGIIGTGMYHVKVVVPNGPATVTFAHGLLYTPLACWVIPEAAEGVTPTVEVATVVVDTNATNLAFSVSVAGTFDVYYG